MSYSMLETERTNSSLDHDTDSLDNAQVAAAPIFAASSTNNPSNNDDVSSAMDTISSGAHANPSPVQFAGAIDTLQSSLGNRATMDFMHQQDQADIHTIAQSGFRNSASAYPFQDQIQQAFGDKHDISGLSAYTGPAARSANAEFGSDAYHKGGNVAFGGEPTLHDAAHEAAHYVQNVGTTQLAGGVGSPGDMYERHADQVADGVLQGKDVSGLLDQSPGGDSQTPTNSAEAPVQMTGGGSLFSRLSRIGSRGMAGGYGQGMMGMPWMASSGFASGSGDRPRFRQPRARPSTAPNIKVPLMSLRKEKPKVKSDWGYSKNSLDDYKQTLYEDSFTNSQIPFLGVMMFMTLLGLGISKARDYKTGQEEELVEDTESDNNLAEYLKEFSPQARQLLEHEISKEQFDGVISAEVVERLLELKEGSPGTVQDLMLKLLPLARQYAQPPVSNYQVGAVGQGESGALYLGANLEIGGSAVGFTVHAEQSVVNNTLLHNEKGLKKLAVTAAPCGHCRQFLNELKAASDIEVVVVGREPTSLQKLLPESFGPKELGLDSALLSETQPSQGYDFEQEDETSRHAMEAFKYSYGPYSESPSAIAVKADGKFYTGTYIENVAFNPSISPLLSALDRMRFDGVSHDEIEEVVLLESKGGKISQASYTEAILKEIAPSKELSRGVSKDEAEEVEKKDEALTGSESKNGFGKYLKEFSPQARQLLEHEISKEQFDGVISAEVVERLLELKEGSPGTVQDLMLKLLPLARQYAQPPVSNYQVGAVGQGESGALYLGANLEIRGSAVGFTVHAEQSVVNNTLLHNEKGLKKLAVTAAPCGHCRQFLNELKAASDIEVVVVGREPTSLQKLLPESFGPKELGLDSALLSETQPSQGYDFEQEDETSRHAMEAFKYSYGPYSESPSAIAVKADGKFYTGTYIENVAFNPSISPLLSALDRMRFDGVSHDEIEEVVLLESKGGKISQASYTEAILKEIAPSAKFRLVKTDKSDH